MVKLTIDRNSVEVSPDMTILQAARKIGITIPTLCYLEGKDPIGACRVCVVEMQGGQLGFFVFNTCFRRNGGVYK